MAQLSSWTSLSPAPHPLLQAERTVTFLQLRGMSMFDQGHCKAPLTASDAVWDASAASLTHTRQHAQSLMLAHAEQCILSPAVLTSVSAEHQAPQTCPQSTSECQSRGCLPAVQAAKAAAPEPTAASWQLHAGFRAGGPVHVKVILHPHTLHQAPGPTAEARAVASITAHVEQPLWTAAHVAACSCRSQGQC